MQGKAIKSQTDRKGMQRVKQTNGFESQKKHMVFEIQTVVSNPANQHCVGGAICAFPALLPACPLGAD